MDSRPYGVTRHIAWPESEVVPVPPYLFHNQSSVSLSADGPFLVLTQPTRRTGTTNSKSERHENEYSNYPLFYWERRNP